MLWLWLCEGETPSICKNCHACDQKTPFQSKCNKKWVNSGSWRHTRLFSRYYFKYIWNVSWLLQDPHQLDWLLTTGPALSLALLQRIVMPHHYLLFIFFFLAFVTELKKQTKQTLFASRLIQMLAAMLYPWVRPEACLFPLWAARLDWVCFLVTCYPGSARQRFG